MRSGMTKGNAATKSHDHHGRQGGRGVARTNAPPIVECRRDWRAFALPVIAMTGLAGKVQLAARRVLAAFLSPLAAFVMIDLMSRRNCEPFGVF